MASRELAVQRILFPALGVILLAVSVFCIYYGLVIDSYSVIFISALILLTHWLSLYFLFREAFHRRTVSSLTLNLWKPWKMPGRARSWLKVYPAMPIVPVIIGLVLGSRFLGLIGTVFYGFIFCLFICIGSFMTLYLGLQEEIGRGFGELLLYDDLAFKEVVARLKSGGIVVSRDKEHTKALRKLGLLQGYPCTAYLVGMDMAVTVDATTDYDENFSGVELRFAPEAKEEDIFRVMKLIDAAVPSILEIERKEKNYLDEGMETEADTEMKKRFSRPGFGRNN